MDARELPKWSEDGRTELGIVIRRALASRPWVTGAQRSELERAITHRLESGPSGVIDTEAVQREARAEIPAWEERVLGREPPRSLGAWPTLCLVVLPLLALGVELLTHLFGNDFFDPIPTWWHVASILTVPLAAYAARLQLRAGRNARPGGWTGALIGFASVVAVGYGVVFIPLVPVSLLLLLFVAGWLMLAPVLAAIAAPIVLVRVGRLALDGRFRRGAWCGACGCVALHVVVATPMLRTASKIRAANVGTPEARTAAVEWLREHADEETLARHISGAPLVIGPIGGYSAWSWFDRKPDYPSADRGDPLWFRVHGSRYSGALPTPIGLAGIGVRRERRISAVVLRASRLAGVVDAETGLARITWTIELAVQDEGWLNGCMKVLLDLPDAAVVTAARWWSADGPLEAPVREIAPRDRHEVYALRHLLSVTAAGDDRVAVCVDSNEKGRARFDLSIVAPFVTTAEGACLRLPRFALRSTVPASGLQHEIALESRHELAVDGLETRTTNDGLFVVEGHLAPQALDPDAPVPFMRTRDAPALVVAYSNGTDVAVLRRRKAEPPVVPPVVVVDGSASNAPHVSAIEASLRAAGVALVFVSVDTGFVRLEGPKAHALADRVRFVGGQDPRPALLEAVDAAIARGADVVWITGPTISWSASHGNELDDRLARGGGVPRILCVQTAPGANELRSDGAAAVLVENVDVAAGLAAALREALGSAARPELEFARSPAFPEQAVQGHSELEALTDRAWIVREARAEGIEAARARATDATCITPFRGALFKHQRWDEDDGTVPPVRVGEIVPSTNQDASHWPGWVLLAAFAGAAALARARRPRQDPAP